MKTNIHTNKGTQLLELEIGLPNWAGELYKEYQEKKMAGLPPSTIISTKRGTAKVSASRYPKPNRKHTAVGLKISSARGTSTRTL